MPKKRRALNVLVLAAGQGKRLRSKTIKLLHPVAGRPMTAHVLDAAGALRPQRLVTVIGYQAEQVRCEQILDPLVGLFRGEQGPCLSLPVDQEGLGRVQGDRACILVVDDELYREKTGLPDVEPEGVLGGLGVNKGPGDQTHAFDPHLPGL